MAEKNPVPIEEQAPSAKAKEQIDERVGEFRKKVHEEHAHLSDFSQGDEVEISKEAEYESITSGQTAQAKGKTGRVVGQAYVAPEGSRHEGKVCRGVMLDNGELITTPEEKLVASTKVSSSLSHISQERWDAIFKPKKKSKRRKNG